MPALATGAVFLVVSAFLASTVEMVEALTIVLAVGVSHHRVANQLVQYGKVVDSELPYMGMTLADLKILSASAYLPSQPPVSSVPGMTTTSPAASAAAPASVDRGALVAGVVNSGPAAD